MTLPAVLHLWQGVEPEKHSAMPLSFARNVARHETNWGWLSLTLMPYMSGSHGPGDGREDRSSRVLKN